MFSQFNYVNAHTDIHIFIPTPTWLLNFNFLNDMLKAESQAKVQLT
jgi:hypothetical protein